MRRLGKAGDGLGFALYLDELTRLLTAPRDYDADVLALYGPEDDPARVLAAVDVLRKQGLRVLALREAGGGLRAGTVMRFTGDDCVEEQNHA